MRNVKVIQEHLGGVKVCDRNLFAGPMSISEVEYWEDRVGNLGKPYTLVQCELTVPVDDSDEDSQCRFARGYCLFADVGE